MLHSALPRAYLGYHHQPHLAGGYFEEVMAVQQQQQHYAYAGYLQQQLEPVQLAWDASSSSSSTASPLGAEQQPRRASTPCPLDLSLKPPPTPEPIEVDDEEDRRSREELASRRSAESCRYSPYRRDAPDQRRPREDHELDEEEEEVVVDELEQTASCYPRPPLQLYEMRTPVKQGFPAALTPPSTPSPPQLARRKHLEEPPVTPPQQQQQKARGKKRHARKLKFDEDTSSPVSGTVILGPDEAAVVTGDIDPAFNIVEVTEEARAELAKIENRLGPYQCKLCRQLHEDAFQLAQHRCSRIAHVEYRCPECDKRFSCPANLASHRRWHKPRPGQGANAAAAAASEEQSTAELACSGCDAKFARQAALRKHVASQHPELANNNNNNNETHEGKQPMGSGAAAQEMA